MSTDYDGKKLNELRVCDLKAELEKRSIEVGGVKADLVKRLQQALKDDGHNPDEYIFECEEKKSPNKGKAAKNKDGDKKDTSMEDIDQDEDPIKLEDVDDLIVKDDADGCDDEDVDEVGVVDLMKDDDEKEAEDEDVSNEKIQNGNNSINDGTTVDNEDSLNLTIGEDEQKIFEEPEEKPKTKTEDKSRTDKSEKNDNKSSESTSESTTVTDKKSSSSSTSKTDKETGADGKSSTVASDKKGDSGNKKDDSDQKTSSKSSSKDDKESSSKSSASKSSSSSSSSASRNLWVSGLSSLTRATDLKIIFSKYGKVIGAKVVTNTRTPGTRCYGYVTMGSSSDASKCIKYLHRTELHGRIILVERTKSDINVTKSASSKSGGDAAAASTTSTSTKSDKIETGGDTVVKSTTTAVNDTKTTETSSTTTAASSTVETTSTSDSKKTTTSSSSDKKDESKSSNADKTTSSSSDKKKESTSTTKSSTGTTTKTDGSTADDKKRETTDKTRRDTQKSSGGGGRSSKSKDRSDSSKKPSAVSGARGREILSFQKIREERERQRLRERERKLREEERRRQEARRRQREEEDRLMRERERLKKERVRLEREKADLLRLERERQNLEREKIELERLELKRQQLKIEEAKRAIKRPVSSDRDRSERYTDDRKRVASERRFEAPPPPRFDTSITSRSTDYGRAPEKKRVDDYPPKRDDYKRDTFKRPISDYSKRDIEPPPRHGGNSFDGRGSNPMSSGSSSSKDRYVNSSESRGAPASFGSGRGRDDRDGKSRYMDSHGTGNSNGDSRYSERTSSAWPNTGPPAVKAFSHIQSVAGNDPWGQKQSESSWRTLEQGQDRYDRTYNERKSSQSQPSQYIEQPRQNSFIGRPQQDRYNNSMSSRFESSGRF